MKEMIKRVREDRGGFTLAELLIVVAIILVLVAIAIPVFSGALTKADEAVAAADIRAVKAEATTKYLLDGETTSPVLYSAVVDKSGNITGLQKVTTGDPTTTTTFKFGTDNTATVIVSVASQNVTATP